MHRIALIGKTERISVISNTVTDSSAVTKLPEIQNYFIFPRTNHPHVYGSWWLDQVEKLNAYPSGIACIDN